LNTYGTKEGNEREKKRLSKKSWTHPNAGGREEKTVNTITEK
jgi:hypothetical protein